MRKKVLGSMKSLMCMTRKMSSVGRSSKGRRWWIRQQLAELRMQGWMNDEYEPGTEWEIWLTHKEEDKKEKPKDWSNSEVWVEKFLDSAEGGPGLLHNITEPRLWRRGAQVIGKNVFENGQPLKRVDVRRAGMQRTLAGRYTWWTTRRRILLRRKIWRMHSRL